MPTKKKKQRTKKQPILYLLNKKRVKDKKQEIKEESLILDIFTNKKCPLCRAPLSSAIISNIEVDYCPKCLGLWFEDEELRWAKDEKDKDLKWLDVDIWKDREKFKISYGIRLCPSCRMPLYEVYYGRSGIIIDVCNLCHGVWLDRGEFKKIIDWLKEREMYEVLYNYAKNLFEEAIEVFSGPETLREEIADFLTILKLLNYKFLVQHPIISQMISQLPK